MRDQARMTDPSNALQSLQEALLRGAIKLERGVLDRDLYNHFDTPNGGLGLLTLGCKAGR
jgi:hypothetical protein